MPEHEDPKKPNPKKKGYKKKSITGNRGLDRFNKIIIHLIDSKVPKVVSKILDSNLDKSEKTNRINLIIEQNLRGFLASFEEDKEKLLDLLRENIYEIIKREKEQKNPQKEYKLGILALQYGKIEEAIARIRNAVNKIDKSNPSFLEYKRHLDQLEDTKQRLDYFFELLRNSSKKEIKKETIDKWKKLLGKNLKINSLALERAISKLEFELESKGLKIKKENKTTEDRISEAIKSLPKDLREKVISKIGSTHPVLYGDILDNDLIEIKKSSDNSEYYIPSGVLNDKAIPVVKNVLYIIGKDTLSAFVRNMFLNTATFKEISPFISKIHGLFMLTDDGLVTWYLGSNKNLRIDRKMEEHIKKKFNHNSGNKDKISTEIQRKPFVDALQRVPSIYKSLQERNLLKNIKITRNITTNPVINGFVLNDKFIVPAEILGSKELSFPQNYLVILGSDNYIVVRPPPLSPPFQIQKIESNNKSWSKGLFMLTKDGLLYLKL